MWSCMLMSELGSRSSIPDTRVSCGTWWTAISKKMNEYVDRNDDALSGLKRGGWWSSTRGYNLCLETVICTTSVLYTMAMCVCPTNLGVIPCYLDFKAWTSHHWFSRPYTTVKQLPALCSASMACGLADIVQALRVTICSSTRNMPSVLAYHTTKWYTCTCNE